MTLLTNLIPGRARPVARTNENETRIKPAFKVREDEHGYVVTIQLPGVDKSGLEITAQANELTVTGRREWAQPAEWTALYRETPRASYQLVLNHEGDIDTDKINAELKEGLLLLHLPKAEAAKPRKIAIN